jgi:hypothetical protein
MFTDLDQVPAKPPRDLRPQLSARRTSKAQNPIGRKKDAEDAAKTFFGA